MKNVSKLYQRSLRGPQLRNTDLDGSTWCNCHHAEWLPLHSLKALHRFSSIALISFATSTYNYFLGLCHPEDCESRCKSRAGTMIYLELEFSVSDIPSEVSGTHSLSQQGYPVQGPPRMVVQCADCTTVPNLRDKPWMRSIPLCLLCYLHTEGRNLSHSSVWRRTFYKTSY